MNILSFESVLELLLYQELEILEGCFKMWKLLKVVNL